METHMDLTPADTAWVQRHSTPGWDATRHARESRAEGRRICPSCDHWQIVTKTGLYRAHRRTDPQRWLTVPCEGSRQPATE